MTAPKKKGRQPRQRYRIAPGMRVNGISLEGQEVVVLGPCTWTGGKSKYKREMKHVKVRIEDKKWLKENKLKPSHQVFTLDNKYKDRYLIPVEVE